MQDHDAYRTMIIEAPIVEDGRIFFKDCSNASSLELACESLNKLILEISSRLTPDNKYSIQVQNLRTDLETVCLRCLKFKKIYGFGSSYNGFRSKNSDVDVVVELIEDGIDSQLIDCKRSMERPSSPFKLKDVVRRAFVPIVTVKHIKTGLDCDISFSVPSICRTDVIWNTALLKAYADSYPEIALAFRFLKYVLNFTKFGSVRTDGLSTYGHILLFIYYLTHRRHPKIPILNVTTHQQTDPNQHKPKLCPAQIVVDYLKFISCELDSSQYLIDLRTNQDVSRRKQCGSLGRLFIQDPYISKNLGKYMKEQPLYNFKVYFSRLLQFIEHKKPTKLSQVDNWCREYQNLCKSMDTPPLHLNCG